jgi:hypothetical protein
MRIPVNALRSSGSVSLLASASAEMAPPPSCEARKLTTIDFDRAMRPVLMTIAEFVNTRRSKPGRNARYGR